MKHPKAVFAAASLGLVFAPSASGEAVAYKGSFVCDPTPTLNVPAFAAPAVASREGDRLTVSRIVYRANTNEEVGRSTGTAAIADGRVAVDLATPSGSISGRFTGTATDTEIALSGTETVKPAAGGVHQRTCKATLTRQ